MNNSKGIGMRLDPQENSNSFWIKSLKLYNRASLTVISDTTNNWYYLKPFTLILVNKGNISDFHFPKSARKAWANIN